MTEGKRDITYTIKLNSEELSVFREAAKLERLSMADTFRRAIRDRLRLLKEEQKRCTEWDDVLP